MRYYLLALLSILLIAASAPAAESVTVGTGTLELAGYFQTGYYNESVSTTPPGTETTTQDTNTFRARRLRLILSSEIVEDIVGGTVMYDFATNGLILGNFWLSPQWDALKLSIGLVDLPFTQEWQVSSSKLYWIYRSAVAYSFTYSGDYGARLDFTPSLDENNKLLLSLLVANGIDTNGNTQVVDFDSELDGQVISTTLSPTEPHYFMSAETKRTDLKDFCARLGYSANASGGLTFDIGVAAMLNKATEFDTSYEYGYDMITVEHKPITADITLKYDIDTSGCLTVLGAYFKDTMTTTLDVYEGSEAQSVVVPITTVQERVTDGMWGGIAYNIPIDGAPLLQGLEPALRYSALTHETTTNGDMALTTDINEIVGGVNFYMMDHNAKIQLNYVMEKQEDTPYSGGTAETLTTTDTDKIQAQVQVRF